MNIELALHDELPNIMMWDILRKIKHKVIQNGIVSHARKKIIEIKIFVWLAI